MHRVLFVAYHFPPVGGAGVQRSVKFVRYLRDFGWEPVVLTGPETRIDRWTPEDDSLSRDVPAETEIVRLKSAPPRSSAGWHDRAVRWAGVPDPFRSWWVDGAVAAGSAQDVDLIYASMSPFESGEVAAALARRLGKPWIADLRDPWALDEMQVYPTRLHQWLELRRMRETLASAAAVVMNTEESARLVRGFPELAGTPVHAIPNGYDAADFSEPATPSRDGTFRVVHTGYLHTETGQKEQRAGVLRRIVGGRVPGVNILTRSHVFLLEAIDRLLHEDRSLAGRLELHLAGVLSSGDLDAAARSPVVRTLGYLPHRESTRLLGTADLLFLPMHDLPPGRRATIVPGKTYEYLASGRPILAAVPDGDARDLLERAGSATLVRPGDVDGMALALASHIARADREEAPPEPRWEAIEPYERRALTHRLATVFDAAADPSRRTSRSAVVAR